MNAQITTIAKITNQISGMNNDGCLLRNITELAYCDICDQLYSMIINKHTVYKDDYDTGMRNVAKDLITGKIYCSRNPPKTTYLGTCGSKDRELIVINMIGRVVLYHLKLIMICPQEGCARLFAFDLKDLEYVYYKNGIPSCRNCSKRLYSNIQSYEELMIKYSTYSSFHNKIKHKKTKSLHTTKVFEPIICDLCDKVILNPKQTAYVFPMDIHICSIHSEQIRNKLKSAFVDWKWDNYHQVKRLLLEELKKEETSFEQDRIQRERDAYNHMVDTSLRGSLANYSTTQQVNQRINKKRKSNTISSFNYNPNQCHNDYNQD